MDWQEFFGRYAAVAVVANSEEADLAELRQTLPPETLFIFFNKAERVLSRGFDRDAVLVVRSGRKGPSVVLKNDLDETVALFAPGRLKQIIQLRTGDIEILLDEARFKPHRRENLDLRAFFAATYPSHKTASSGYAIALWLVHLVPQMKVVISGFSAIRTRKWVVFPSHAWTFEQLALRLLVRQGRLVEMPPHEAAGRTVAALRRQFPDVPDEELVLPAFEVLTERLESTNIFLDRLWAMTRFSRGLYNVYDRSRSLFRRHRT